MPRSTQDAAAQRRRIARRIDAIQRAVGPHRAWTAREAADALGITPRGARKIIEHALALRLIARAPVKSRTPCYRMKDTP
jgi:predicted ArsR family transcriptional regulator